jgi:hypothetical protein
VAACAPPTIAVPSQVTVDATSSAGVAVSYDVTFGDPGGSGLAVSACSPASGGVFVIGTTTVTCSATTNAGVSATASFLVLVKSATDQLGDLYDQVAGIGTGHPIGPGTSLVDKITLVEGYLEAGNTATACGTLNAFINQVSAQSAHIGPTLAAQLIAQARQIEAVIGC